STSVSVSKAGRKASARPRRRPLCKFCWPCSLLMRCSRGSFSLGDERNDEALMTNDEGMTKSEGQSPREDYDPFGGDGNTAVVREEADEENDEARMTNDERMTKHDAREAPECDEAFWTDAKVSIVREEPDAKRVFDLEERTARFGEAVIDFARSIPQG